VTTPSTTFIPISSQNITGNLNRFFTLFCNEIIDNNSRQSLINNLTLNLVSDTIQLTKSIVETTINGLVPSFTIEKNAQTNKVDTFFNSPDYLSYKNYNPQVSNQSIVGKTRNFSYTSAGATPTQNENLKNLYSNVNVNLDKTTFNGKIIFD
jgi:hypothetical protein